MEGHIQLVVLEPELELEQLHEPLELAPRRLLLRAQQQRLVQLEQRLVLVVDWLQQLEIHGRQQYSLLFAQFHWHQHNYRSLERFHLHP